VTKPYASSGTERFGKEIYDEFADALQAKPKEKLKKKSKGLSQSGETSVFKLPDRKKKQQEEEAEDEDYYDYDAEQGAQPDNDVDDDDDGDGRVHVHDWGQDIKNYYGGDARIDKAGDSEDERAEEEEAQRILRARAKRVREQDLELDLMGDDEDQEVEDQKESEKAKEDKDEVVAIDKETEIARMTPKQRRRLVKTTAPELLPLARDCGRRLADVDSYAVACAGLEAAKIQQATGTSDAGAAFIAAKRNLLVAYGGNVAFYLALKAKGADVKSHPVVQQIVKLRQLFEKLDPLGSGVEEKVALLAEHVGQAGALDPTESEAESGEEDRPAVNTRPAQRRSMKDMVMRERERIAKRKARNLDPDDLEEAPALSIDDLLRMPTTAPAPKKRRVDKEGDISLRASDLTEKDPIAGTGKKYKAALVSDTLNNVSQLTTVKKKVISGDDEVSYAKRPPPKSKAGSMTYDELVAMQEEEEELSPDEIARAARLAKLEAKRLADADAAKAPKGLDPEVEGKRKLNRDVEKAQGLTRHRKKEMRNSRVARKKQYEKMLKKRKGVVQEMREGAADGGYEGEATGMRSHVKHSIKLT